MQRQFDEKQVDQVLKLATGLLPQKPVWAVLQECDGIPIGSLNVDNVDEKAAMIAASNALCERCVKHTGHGDFRYVFMFGDTDIYFAIRLNMMYEDMLGLGFESLASVDSIINTLPAVATVLNNLLLE